MRIHHVTVAVVSLTGTVLTVSPAMASPAAADVVTLDVTSRQRPLVNVGSLVARVSAGPR